MARGRLAPGNEYKKRKRKAGEGLTLGDLEKQEKEKLKGLTQRDL